MVVWSVRWEFICILLGEDIRILSILFRKFNKRLRFDRHGCEGLDLTHIQHISNPLILSQELIEGSRADDGDINVRRRSWGTCRVSGSHGCKNGGWGCDRGRGRVMIGDRSRGRERGDRDSRWKFWESGGHGS